MQHAATAPATRASALARYLPILTWLPTYQRSWLRADLIAGVTVWALVVPQAIAYAGIAGLPAQAGLFTAFAGLLGYALFGTSRQLVVSPTSASAAISASLIAPLALGDVAHFAGLSSALALLIGVLTIALGLWHMGFLSRFIATPVQVGLMFGLGMTIIVDQAVKLFGISGSEGAFFPQLWHLLTHLGETNWWTLALGLVGLTFLLLCRRFAPNLPAALIVVVAGVAVTALFGLVDRGVAVVGKVEGGVPLPAIPNASFSDLIALLPGALAITVIGYAESNTVAEEFAEEHRYTIRPDQELIALGAASTLSGLFQGFFAGGGASQSAANDRAGARTQVSSLVVSGLTLLTAVALLPLFQDLPDAILGAIVISAVLGFLRVKEMRRIWHLRREGFVLASLALLGVLFLGVMPGLLITISLSLLLLLGRLSRPGGSVLGRYPGTSAYADVARYPVATTEPGLLIFRLNAQLIFINATVLRDRVRDLVQATDPPIRVVVADLSFSDDLDIKGLDTLAGLHEQLAEDGIALWLADVHGPVAEMLRLGKVASAIGEAHLYRTVEEAVAAYHDEQGAALPAGSR